MVHPILFPPAPSAPRVRIAFLVTVGLLLALAFTGVDGAAADGGTTQPSDLSSGQELTVPGDE